MDGTETERRIALDRKHGLANYPLVVSFPVSWWYSQLVDKKGPGSHLRLVRDDVPQSFYDEVTRMVEAIEKEKKNYQWPEFLYYPVDEPGTHPAAVNFMVGASGRSSCRPASDWPGRRGPGRSARPPRCRCGA